MGYTLYIDDPNIGSFGRHIGGKFFGYLDDDEFNKCKSAQFLRRILGDEADLLNVWWSCYGFVLDKVKALQFLALYAIDVKLIKGEEYVEEILAARRALYMHNLGEAEQVKFSMG